MLDAVDIGGRTITADALHTQRAFAEYVVGRDAHYHLTAKENQPTLLDDVRLWFESPGEADHEQTDLEHGRIETRRIWVTSKLNEYLEFPHVGQAFMVERTVEYKNKRRKGWREYAYGITSLSAEQADAEQVLKESLRLRIQDYFPVGAGMRKVLEFHRCSFMHWRYKYESRGGSFFPPALDEALTVIIE